MELLLTRDQAGGMLGGIKFKLTARAKLTTDEASAVDKYKLNSIILYEKPTDGPNSNSFLSLAAHRFTVPRIDVSDLVRGKTIEAKDIVEIMGAEEQLKTAAKNFHQILTAAASFGGETVHTFTAE